jgi:hypothetical protein
MHLIMVRIARVVDATKSPDQRIVLSVPGLLEHPQSRVNVDDSFDSSDLGPRGRSSAPAPMKQW